MLPTKTYFYRGMRNRQDEAEKFGTVVSEIETILADRNVTVKDFCKETGTNPVVLRRVIDGITWPSPQLVARLCTFLNCTPDDLFTHIPAGQ